VHHFLSDLNPQYWQFWMGAALILTVLFARDGLMGLLRGLAAKFVQTRGK
jgi:branched-chain amino acid transport system permease protein